MGMSGYAGAVNKPDLDRLLADPEIAPEFLLDRRGAAPGWPVLDLDKSWHGIHYLLTGELWGGDGPLADAVLGGDAVGPDLGYGPARLLRPDRVAAVAQALAEVAQETLTACFVPAVLTEMGVYPQIWDEGQQALDYLLGNYRRLAAFYERAAREGSAVLLAIL
jgi:hypothetical protein